MNYEILIQEAKNKIDEGFDKMGRKIDSPSFLERYLVAATLKAIRLSDTITILCKNNFTNESLIILRSLIEHCINMRWVMDKNTDKRLKEYLSDLGKIKLGNFWAKQNLETRMKEIGFLNKDYYDYVVKLTYGYSHVNASSLEWSKVINDDRLRGESFSAQAIYSIVAQMLGHVLKSLDIHFDGFFNYYDHIWRKIKVDKSSIRERLEKILIQFKNDKKSKI